MGVSHSVVCEPSVERHPTSEGPRIRGRGRSFIAWERPFQSMFKASVSAVDRQWSLLRLESALASVALLLLVETLVGHAFTVLGFALVVAMSLCGRIGKPLLLGTTMVVLVAHTFVLGSVSTSSWMIAVWLMVWGLEGLLINALTAELLTGATGSTTAKRTCARSEPFRTDAFAVSARIVKPEQGAVPTDGREHPRLCHRHARHHGAHRQLERGGGANPRLLGVGDPGPQPCAFLSVRGSPPRRLQSELSRMRIPKALTKSKAGGGARTAVGFGLRSG